MIYAAKEIKYSTLKKRIVKIRLGVSARIINQVTYYARTSTYNPPIIPPLKGGKVLIYNVNTFYILFILFISV